MVVCRFGHRKLCNIIPGSLQSTAGYIGVQALRRSYHVITPRVKSLVSRFTYMFRIPLHQLPFIFHRYHSTCQKNFIRMSNQQPEWSIPIRQADEPVLNVYNSLTRSKVCLHKRSPHRLSSLMSFKD